MSYMTLEEAKNLKQEYLDRIEDKQNEIKKLVKKLDKELQKGNWAGVQAVNRDISWQFKNIERTKEWLPERDYVIKRAEWVEQGYKVLVDFLEGIFISDMGWYQKLQDFVAGLSSAELNNKIKSGELSGSDYTFSQKTQIEAQRFFRADIEMRFKKFVTAVEKKVGKIKDLDNLKVNQKGHLDGFVVGEYGEASVNTVGAGGHTVQRFHYRTLIKEVK